MTPKKRRYHCVVLGRFQHISPVHNKFTRLSVNSIFSILALSNSLKILNKENSQSKYSAIIESVNNRSFITEKSIHGRSTTAVLTPCNRNGIVQSYNKYCY